MVMSYKRDAVALATKVKLGTLNLRNISLTRVRGRPMMMMAYFLSFLHNFAIRGQRPGSAEKKRVLREMLPFRAAERPDR